MLALAAASGAVVRDTVTFTNIDSGITPSVQTHTFTVGGYNLNHIHITGTFEEINGTTNDFASENRIKITAPNGANVEIQASTVGGYTGPFNADINLAGVFASYAMTGAGTWSFAFRNSFDDAPTGGVADANWSTVTFDMDDAPVPPPSFTNLGTLTDTDPDYMNADVTANQTGGAVKWYRVSLPQAVSGYTGRFMDLRLSGGAAGVGLFDSAGALLFSTTSTGLTDGNIMTGAETIRPDGITTPTWNTPTVREFPAGDYYIAIGGDATTFNSGFIASTTSTDTTTVFTLGIRDNLADTFAGAAAPTEFLDQGAIGDTTADYATPDVTASFTNPALTTSWVKFTIGQPVSDASGYFLDIDTNGSAGTTSDTELMLFDDNGNMLGNNDDGGAGVNSLLSYGQTSPARGPVDGGDTAIGQNGNLAAGTYWLAITTYNSRAATKWSVQNIDGDGTEAIVNWRTNLPGTGGGAITGNIVLQDWVPGPAGRTVSMEFYSGFSLMETDRKSVV